MSTPSLSKDQLLAMTPQRYLAQGWRAANGRPHAYLNSSCAIAACAQLEKALVAPQELSSVLEAYRQVLPYYGENPVPRLTMATQDVLDLVTATLGQTTNPGLLAWLEPCVLAVQAPDDLRAFMGHLKVVAQQYAALIAIRAATP